MSRFQFKHKVPLLRWKVDSGTSQHLPRLFGISQNLANFGAFMKILNIFNIQHKVPGFPCGNLASLARALVTILVLAPTPLLTLLTVVTFSPSPRPILRISCRHIAATQWPHLAKLKLVPLNGYNTMCQIARWVIAPPWAGIFRLYRHFGTGHPLLVFWALIDTTNEAIIRLAQYRAESQLAHLAKERFAE